MGKIRLNGDVVCTVKEFVTNHKYITLSEKIFSSVPIATTDEYNTYWYLRVRYFAALGCLVICQADICRVVALSKNTWNAQRYMEEAYAVFLL